MPFFLSFVLGYLKIDVFQIVKIFWILFNADAFYPFIQQNIFNTGIMESAAKDSKIFHSMMKSPSFVGKPALSNVTTTVNVPYHRIQEQIELY